MGKNKKRSLLYKSLSKCCKTEENNRLKTDLHKHNWLLLKLKKLVKKGSMAERAVSKKSTQEKKKSASKIRKPSLPVSLPIALYEKFLRNKISLKSIENNMGDTGLKPVDLSTKSRPTELLIPTKFVNPIRVLSSQDFLRDGYGYNLKKKINQSTQTATADLSPLITQNQREILKTIEKYGFTVLDLDTFYQNSIKDNNNHRDKENVNLIDILEISNSSVESIDDVEIIEELSNRNYASKIQNSYEANENNSISSQNQFASSNASSCTTLQYLEFISDLNKLVYGKFCEAIKFKIEGGDVKKEIPKYTNSLVKDIMDLFSKYNENLKYFNIYPESIEIFDENKSPENVQNESTNMIIEPQQNSTEDVGNVDNGSLSSLSTALHDPLLGIGLLPSTPTFSVLGQPTSVVASNILDNGSRQLNSNVQQRNLTTDNGTSNIQNQMNEYFPFTHAHRTRLIAEKRVPCVNRNEQPASAQQCPRPPVAQSCVRPPVAQPCPRPPVAQPYPRSPMAQQCPSPRPPVAHQCPCPPVAQQCPRPPVVQPCLRPPMAQPYPRPPVAQQICPRPRPPAAHQCPRPRPPVENVRYCNQNYSMYLQNQQLQFPTDHPSANYSGAIHQNYLNPRNQNPQTIRGSGPQHSGGRLLSQRMPYSTYPYPTIPKETFR